MKIGNQRRVSNPSEIETIVQQQAKELLSAYLPFPDGSGSRKIKPKFLPKPVSRLYL